MNNCIWCSTPFVAKETTQLYDRPSCAAKGRKFEEKWNKNTKFRQRKMLTIFAHEGEEGKL